MDELLEEEFIVKIKVIEKINDTEVRHAELDDLLCAFLNTLGYEKLVDEYNKSPKWYA